MGKLVRKIMIEFFHQIPGCHVFQMGGNQLENFEKINHGCVRLLKHVRLTVLSGNNGQLRWLKKAFN